MEIVLRPIGYIRTRYSDEEVSKSLYGVDGYIEILSEYEQGLEGLEGFSHIMIIAYLHKVNMGNIPLRVRPFRRLARMGIVLPDIPIVGVFATDSPHRPNPIALTIARLLRRDGNILHVANLDLYNGTPVLDIKPYGYSRRIDNISVPQWYESIWNIIRGTYAKQ